ncbi:MAG: C39 family peptidase [Victivallales bacterium]|nr:C39 family peptidase [Victivallales bacterium]
MCRIAVTLIVSLLCLTALGGVDGSRFYARKSGKSKQVKVDRKDLKVNRKGAQSKRELKDNVVNYRTARYIKGIPMVDQKNRAYCAVATVQRHLKYYFEGSSVNIRKLADSLGADKERGTNIAYMVKAIQQYSRELRLNVEISYAADAEEVLQKYNRAAKKPVKFSGRLSTDELEDIIRKIDFSTWKKIRAKESGARKQAWNFIRRNIDNGIPVTWSVWLGLVSEQGRKMTAGGHMRMIIGYDAKRGKIIYTDSWGEGHSRKEMDWDDAWAITSRMMVMTPKR